MKTLCEAIDVVETACHSAGINPRQARGIFQSVRFDVHHDGVFEIVLNACHIAYGDAEDVVKFLCGDERLYVLDAYAPAYVKFVFRDDFSENPFGGDR